MQKNAAWPCRAAFFPSFFSVPAAFSEFFLLVRVDSGGLMCYNLVTKFSTEVLYMADVKKGEGLVYKNHPLRRVDNLIYYGSMADKYIVMFQILDTKKEQDLNVATRVSVQLQLTDPRSALPRPRGEEVREGQPVRRHGCGHHLAGAGAGRKAVSL